MTRRVFDTSLYVADGEDPKIGYLDLAKFYGKPIKAVLGYLGGDGFMAFGLSCVVFEDGTDLFVEGEHDFAFVYGGSHGKSAQPPVDLDALDYADPERHPDDPDDGYMIDDYEE